MPLADASLDLVLTGSGSAKLRLCESKQTADAPSEAKPDHWSEKDKDPNLIMKHLGEKAYKEPSCGVDKDTEEASKREKPDF